MLTAIDTKDNKMYNLNEFEKLVESGHVRKVTNAPLVLYNYTEKATFDRAWDTKYTRDARGIIFEAATGKLIAKPFPKFFNLGEQPETMLLNLPNEAYCVTEKLDGSLGIIYYYDNEWQVATRGSFSSPQAIKAKEMLNKYRTETFTPGCTYLVEIIYPDNKIVVSYDKEELVMIGAYYHDGVEMPRAAVVVSAAYANMPASKQYAYTIDEMVTLQHMLDKDQEGFVVRFDQGLRIKIKGKEYLRIHKLISELSPIAFWESMDSGIVNREYMQHLPEEFRSEFEPIVNHLEDQYAVIKQEIMAEIKTLPSLTDFKVIGMLTQNPDSGLKHPGAVFPFLLNKPEALNKYILKRIRPDGNILKVL